MFAWLSLSLLLNGVFKTRGEDLLQGLGILLVDRLEDHLVSAGRMSTNSFELVSVSR